MIPQLSFSLTSSAVRAAIEGTVTLHAVTDDATLTVFTTGRERMNGTFEAVECVGSILVNHGKRSVVLIVAHIASSHLLPLLLIQLSHIYAIAEFPRLSMRFVRAWSQRRSPAEGHTKPNPSKERAPALSHQRFDGPCWRVSH